MKNCMYYAEIFPLRPIKVYNFNIRRTLLSVMRMRPVLVILIFAIAMLQYKLWLGDGNVLQCLALEKKLQQQLQNNTNLLARNEALEFDIAKLKQSNASLEEHARQELGMIRQGETYYQFLN